MNTATEKAEHREIDIIRQELARLRAQRDELLASVKNLAAICEGGWIPPEDESPDFVRGWELACGEFRASNSLKRSTSIIERLSPKKGKDQ